MRAKYVAAGAFHSGCVDVDGNLYIWGHGGYWQLGLGISAHECYPQQVGVQGWGWLCRWAPLTPMYLISTPIWFTCRTPPGIDHAPSTLKASARTTPCSQLPAPRLQAELALGFSHSISVGNFGNVSGAGPGPHLAAPRLQGGLSLRTRIKRCAVTWPCPNLGCSPPPPRLQGD